MKPFLWAITLGVLSLVGYAQDRPTLTREGNRGRVTVYFTTALENDSSWTVSMQTVKHLPHRVNLFHRHPGCA